MRLLNFDPGGEKLGWGVVDQGPAYVNSGVCRWPRGGRPQQEYRMELTEKVRGAVFRMFEYYEPDRVVAEIVPSQGSDGFLKSGQSYIANVVATTIHNCAMQAEIPVVQVSARTWSTRIAMRKSRSAKVTKPQIRNGVLYHFPHLKKLLPPAAFKEWDRWDATGIGLFMLGARTPQP